MTRPTRDNIYRVAYPAVEMRGDFGTGTPPTLTGHFAIFDSPTEINSVREGNFMETIARGAFTKTFAENRDTIKALFQHGRDPQIGDKPLGTITELREDDVGAYYEVEMIDTSYNRDLLPGLRAGLYGASFRFQVMRMDPPKRDIKPSATNPRGIQERVVREVQVMEMGPVTWPAYKDATAGVRSITDTISDVDSLARAGAVVFDAERMNQCQVFISRGVDVEDENAEPTLEPFISRDLPDDAPQAEMRSARRYDRICEYVGDTVWAIHPPALMTIISIIGERSAGYIPSDEEIRERIGTQTRVRDQAPDESSVAVIDINGTIMPKADMIDNSSSDGTSIESLKADIRSALASDDVKAILLNIDSPGGAVDLVPEMASEIRSARGSKPIIALANTFVASAAYWLASAADEIIVTPSGQVGSIGVYNAHQDKSKMQEKLGVKTTLVSAAKYKTEGNPFEPLTEDAQAEMQKRVDAYYDMFVSAVAKGRGTDIATVKSEYGEGRMMMATDAVAVGMADKIATFDETLARLEREARKSGGASTTTAASSDIVEPEDAPPDSAEPSLAHPIRGRRDKSKSYLRKEKPSWQL